MPSVSEVMTISPSERPEIISMYLYRHGEIHGREISHQGHHRPRLHQERRASSGKMELSMDDLDYVAAAGTNTPPQIGTGKKSTTE